jgi:uncharacterized protein (DUF1778 family)
MIAAKSRKIRDERLSIRITSERKQLIAKAAEKENKNISDFILEKALSAAEAIVFDDSSFGLDKTQWKSFMAALDAPPRNIPALRKLLTEPGVFDAK